MGGRAGEQPDPTSLLNLMLSPNLTYQAKSNKKVDKNQAAQNKKYITARGDSPNVPKYLRFNGKVCVCVCVLMVSRSIVAGEGASACASPHAPAGSVPVECIHVRYAAVTFQSVMWSCSSMTAGSKRQNMTLPGLRRGKPAALWRTLFMYTCRSGLGSRPWWQSGGTALVCQGHKLYFLPLLQI